jgi:hypothetical protein
MANLLSPGVQVIEKDLTQIVPKVSTSRGAYSGRFNWGPVLDPQLVSNEPELVTVFGKPNNDTYESFFTAANFLQYSNSMYVNRADSANLKNAVAKPSSSVENITLVTAGSGYTSVPAVQIGAPNTFDGQQAVAVAVLQGAGVIIVPDAGVNYLPTNLITASGTGFTVGMKVLFSTPQQTVDVTDDNGVVTQQVVTAQGEIAELTVGTGIARIKITQVGAGYTSPATVTGITNPDGSTVDVNTFTHDPIPVGTSVLKAINVTVEGSGYTSVPTVTISGGGGSTQATGTAVILPVGIKIRNKNHYEQNFIDGQGNFGPVAAKYAGALGNSLLFAMADNATFDTTVDGRFFARTRVERFESNAEISRVRRLIPAAFPGSSATSTFTAAASTFVGKVIRTSASNTRQSGAAGGAQSYANIELGLVRSVEAGNFIKVTLAKANPYLKGAPNTPFVTPVLANANVVLNRTGLAATVIGTFDGYAKVWDARIDDFVIDTQSFYIKLNTAGAALTLSTTGTDALSISQVANRIVTANQMLAGYSYTINVAGTTNFTLAGAANNIPGTTFTATRALTGNGSVRTVANVGAIRRVEKTEVLNMVGNNKAEALNAVCDREWRYSKEFTRAPGTSTFAANVGGQNDEVHMLLIDATGLITGAAGTVIQKWEGASKAGDAKSSNGTSSYYKNLINNSGWIWWLDTPDTADILGRANWGAVAKNNNFDALANNPDVTLAGGDDGDALTEANIMDAYEMFSDASAFDISLMPTGNVSANTASWIIENVAALRKDVVAFVSAPLLIGTASDIATEMVQYRDSIDVGDAAASYGVMDSGWKYQYDRYNDVFRWIPLNGDVAGLCAYTDNVSDAWFSPGGFNRGQIKNVTKLAFNPTQAQRDLLYVGGINPVVTFPGEGTILYGDKTMQKKSSAFDRINVRRLFIVLEKAVANAAKYQLFEFNDDFTRAQFKNLVEPFLRDVQGRRGIVDFRVKCDTTNNTPAVIDANEFIADIYIKPNRSINYITLNFIATKTGVSFETVGL